VTFDNYEYDLVAIGGQCWFAENLRSEHYTNGDTIPGELNDEDWSNYGATSLGAQAVYNNDASSLSDYGRLYNWYAVDDARGLCPIGWHVPSDGDFMTLEMEVGMSESAANSTGWRTGLSVGSQLKSSIADSPSWNGTNTTGFSALPAGFRRNDALFFNEGSNAYFWTSSSYEDFAWYRSLATGLAGVGRFDGNRKNGNSVRCVRD